MNDLEKAARQALEALECHADIGIKADKAIVALRQALEQTDDLVSASEIGARLRRALKQPNQKPVAYSYTSRITGVQAFSPYPKPPHLDSVSWDIKPLYTEPPQRNPLTRDQALKIVAANPDAMTAVRMTEAAHGIGEKK